MKTYDRGYKRFLGKKSNFLKFIENFVKKDWFDAIDPEHIEMIDKEFVLKDLEGRESDIIYKAKINNEDVYFYILVELQSKPDFSMPFRFLVYMTELLKRVFNNTNENERVKKDFKLPSIVPILLYNGEKEWYVDLSFKNYLSKSELFGNNVIDFSYVLVNLNDYSIDDLLNAKDIVSVIFSLDKKQDDTGLLKTLKAAFKNISRFTKDEQQDLFDWIYEVLVKVSDNKKLINDVVESFKLNDEERMVKAMEATLLEIKQEGIDIGMEKGIEKGMEKGIEKEKNETAKKMIKSGFSLENIMIITELTKEQIEKLGIN